MKDIKEIRIEKLNEEFVDRLSEASVRRLLKTVMNTDKTVSKIIMDVFIHSEDNRCTDKELIENEVKSLFYALETMDFMEAWRRSGSKGRGKKKEISGLVVYKMFEELIHPYKKQLLRYYEEKRYDLEREYLIALMKAFTRFDDYHTNPLYEMLIDEIADFMGETENEWKIRHFDEDEYRQPFYDYVKADCPNWDTFFDDPIFDEDGNIIEEEIE